MELFKGKIITVECRTTLLPNGATLDMEVIRHPGGAAIVAIDGAQRVCLLYQYRPAIDQWLWEIPAGKIDHGEPPLATARRELAEEAGTHAARWDDLGTIISSPGVFTERVALYLARDLTAVAPQADAHEIFEVHWVSLNGAVSRALQGDITDAKSVIALLRARAFLDDD